MIQDHTIDQTLIELARTMKALKALRAARKVHKGRYPDSWSYPPSVDASAATRASMDLTRKLADLRCGR